MIETTDLKFTYPTASKPCLNGINLKIYDGELTIIAGPTGCGKSTLCCTFNGIIPHLSSGFMEGDVTVDGLNTRKHKVFELAQHVGMVFQNPEEQIFSLKVEDEVAFGPENLGLSHEEIVKRVDQAIEWVGLQSIMNALTVAISGGQKQKVSIASNLAMLPKIMVLDEPTTDLDPVSTEQVVSTIFDLKKKLGITFIIVEHDLSEIVEIADRLIILADGKIFLDGTPRDVLWDYYEQVKDIGLRIPQHIELGHLIRETEFGKEERPIKTEESLGLLRKYYASRIGELKGHPLVHKKVASTREIAMSIRNLWYAYRRNEYVLRGIDLDVHEGEFLAIIGPNGSGKSTLAKIMIGLLKPSKGDVFVYGLNTRKADMKSITEYAGFLFQNPDSQLFTSNVWAEMEFGLKIKRIDQQTRAHIIDEIISLLGLDKYKSRHPFSLSRGERKRLAVASVLLTRPKLVILDEPTTGQDQKNLLELMSLMKRLNEQERATIIMITHDMQLVANFASRVLVMTEGRIVLDGPPRKIFFENFRKLEELRLRPPTIAQFSQSLRSYGFPSLLNLDEFKQIIY